MDSEELDSQRRQGRLRRRRQRERDARARETAEQREARLARRRERYRRQESQHTRQAQMDANRAAQRLRREAETPEVRQERLQHHTAAERLRREAETPEARQERLQHHRAAERLRREAAFCACAALTVTTIYPFHWQKIHKFAWITEQTLVWYRVDKAAVVARARQPNEPRPQSRSLQRVAQDAAQMQPRERMQQHQPTHGTLLAHTSPPRPFFGFFFFFSLSDQSIDESFFKAKPL